MVTFDSVNVDGNRVSHSFDDLAAMKDDWMGDADHCPANDDAVFDVRMDGERTVIPDGTAFEQMLISFGLPEP